VTASVINVTLKIFRFYEYGSPSKDEISSGRSRLTAPSLVVGSCPLGAQISSRV
jgi:hypothetical protein